MTNKTQNVLTNYNNNEVMLEILAALQDIKIHLGQITMCLNTNNLHLEEITGLELED